MKDYKQFLLDTKNDEKLTDAIRSEMKELAKLYPSNTDRELLTIAAKAHGYGFSVLDVMNTQLVLKLQK